MVSSSSVLKYCSLETFGLSISSFSKVALLIATLAWCARWSSFSKKSTSLIATTEILFFLARLQAKAVAES